MADPKSYIGALVQAIAAVPGTIDSSGYATLFSGSPSTIGKIITVGPIGDQHADITVTTLAGRTLHANGAADGGNVPIGFAYDPATDAGQQLMLTNNGTNNPVSFKITDPDGKITYFYGVISNFQDNQRDASSMKGFTFTIRVNNATIRPGF